MAEQYIREYRIIGDIGAGGMASVQLAVHRDVPNLKVVLKKLSDRSLADRFKREADKLALLDGQPGICQIKNFFDHEGDFYIAMEYIEGQDLGQLLSSENHIERERAVQIIQAVLRTLDFAHRLGISHRDIKPTNIMIDRHGQVKIIDFGLAKGKTDSDLTMVGTVVGSPRYMAPEQFSFDERTDWARCDIYAVGVTLYYLLTGRLPFKSRDIYELRDEKWRGGFAPPSAIDPAIPAELDAVTMRALAIDPTQRYADAAAMLADLNRAAAGQMPPPAATATAADFEPTRMITDLPPGAPVPGPSSAPAPVSTPAPVAPPVAPPMTQPVAPPARRGRPRAAMVAAAAGLLVIVAVAGIYLGSRRAGQPAVSPAAGPELAATDTAAAVAVIAEPAQEPAQEPVQEPVQEPIAAPVQEPRPGAPAAAVSPAVLQFGKVRVGSLPGWGYDIYIDGKLQSKPTNAEFTLPVGRHVIKVVAVLDGVAKEMEKTVTVVPGEIGRHIFDLGQLE